MLLYLSCLWMCGILTVHTAAQHPSRQEERGALRGWKRQSAGTPTPVRPEPVKGTGEKLSGRRAPLSGWAGGRTSRVVGLYFSFKLLLCLAYRSARVYVAQWTQLEFLWNSFVCLLLFSFQNGNMCSPLFGGKSYVSVKYSGNVDQIWLNVGYLYQNLRKSLVLLSYWWLMLDRFW